MIACARDTGSWEHDDCVVVGSNTSEFEHAPRTTAQLLSRDSTGNGVLHSKSVCGYDFTTDRAGFQDMLSDGHGISADAYSCKIRPRNLQPMLDPTRKHNDIKSDQAGWEYLDGKDANNYKWQLGP